MLLVQTKAEICHLKAILHEQFTIKDLGLLHYFLGLEVTYIPQGIVLSQRKFTKELLTDMVMLHCKPACTSLPMNTHFTTTDGTPHPDPTLYRNIIGKINFLINTRPDLSYAAQTLSQFMQNPTTVHMAAVQHILRYIKGSLGQGILLRGSDQLTIHAYSDSDWATCLMTRISVTGYIVLFGGSPISWKSKKQSTVAKSSSEVDYRAMAQTSFEVTWLVHLLEELGVTNLRPIRLYCDNQSALHIAHNQVFQERTKHIDLDCHFTREKVMEGLIEKLFAYQITIGRCSDQNHTFCSA